VNLFEGDPQVKGDKGDPVILVVYRYWPYTLCLRVVACPQSSD
jgi:hypothetical protein